MKKLFVLLMFCCMVTACGKNEDVKVNDSNASVEVTDDQSSESVVTGIPEEENNEVSVKPLPSALDVDDLNDCTLAVSFEKGNAYVDDTGSMKLDVIVYTYDLYDMVDFANLKVGDSIVISGVTVSVESLERTESGSVIINGGIENGGYEFIHNDDGVYFEQGMSDIKSYYPFTNTSFKVSPDFEFVDSSDLDKEEVTYYPGDFLTDDAGIVYNFTPHNTSIVVENGLVTHMTRVYTP